MAIDLGDVHTLTHLHVVNGALADAGTMSLLLTRPDGTVVTVTPVTSTGVGRYRHDHLTAQVGRHTARWVGTGANPGAAVDVFDVRPADPGYVVSLADVKAQINVDTYDTEHDDELRSMIEAATEVAEDMVGPVVVRTRTEVHAGGPLLVLHHAPVVALTSLTPIHPTAVAYLPVDLDLDGATGIVRRLDGGGFGGPVRVVYIAGRRSVPASIVEGVKLIAAHMWDTQRGHAGARPGFGEDDLMSAPGRGFLVPHRAMEAFRPHLRGPVLA